MPGFLVRLRALIRRSDTQAELDEELRYHFDREIERNLARGLSGRDARDAAHRTLGNLTVHTESARAAYGWTWLEQLAQDAAYGWRALMRSRVFTAVTVLSLALGIGANIMIFGVVYGVLFEPLPVPHPERLVSLERVTGTERDQSFSAMELDALRRSGAVAGITATRDADNTPVVIGHERTFVTIDLVDSSYSRTIGLHALRGRVIDATDVAAAAPVAFVSQAFAERSFGSPERALGKVVRVRDVPVSIIGVAPAAFRGLEYPGWFAIAVPISLAPALGMPDFFHRTSPSFGAVARLAPGIDRRQAEPALDALFQRCCIHPSPERLTTVGMTAGIAGGKDDARDAYAPLLYLLMAGAGVVLLIACANVGNLLLVRAAAREHEIAVRMSLGASRRRVVRQLLTESLLLGLLGGVVAFPLSAWGTLGVERLIPSNMAVYADIVRWHPKPALIAFTAAVSVACVSIFGLVPAVRATRATLTASLKTGGRGSVGSGRRLLDRGIVVVQLSLALLLVSAASLLVTTLRNIMRTDGGFATSGITLISVETRGTPYERDGIVPLHAEILRRVRAVPRVASAGMASLMPISGGRNAFASVETASGVAFGSVRIDGVTRDYLGTMGIALVAGRDFTDRDDASSEPVAIISESVAHRAFPGKSPLGGTIRVVADTTWTYRVIGVARDTKMVGLRGERVPMVYAPAAQTAQWPFLGVAVRMPDGSDVLTRRVTEAIESAYPGIRLRRISTMRQSVRESMFTERMTASISTLFGSLALLLAAIGIYGVVAFTVARRTNEIGVRMALGARRADIAGLVLRTSMALVGVGVVIAGPLVFVAGKALRAQLYGVSAHDPVLLMLALGVLVVVAVIATSVPAHRATKIDPLVALRTE